MNKYNLTNKCMIGIWLIAFIGVNIVLNIITPNKVFSESENRKLEQAPVFSLNELFHGKFTSNYEKYISDQFVLRDFWMGIKSDSERAIGKKEGNGVFIGKDGYLIQTFKKPSDNSVDEKIKAINDFAASTPKLNKYFMLVPNSVKILEDKLPLYAPVDDQLIYINKVEKSIDKSIKVVDVYDTLYSKKNEYIFYKTDHHWTTKGAYYAYEKLANEMGFTPNAAENYFEIKECTDSFYGTSYSKGGFKHLNPDSVELYIPKVIEKYRVQYVEENKESDSLYNMDNLNKKDKYAVFLGGNHPLIKITTNVANDKRLLIVKDSYANSIIPFLTGHYSEIYVVDLRYYSDNLNALIKKKSIDDMLMLYNANTFFEDESVINISENIDMVNLKENNTSENVKQDSKKGENNDKGNNTNSTTASSISTAIRDYNSIFKKDVFMGDSISEGLYFYEFLDEDIVIAKKGININKAKDEIKRISSSNPENIFLLYGVNDMDDTMPSTWFIDNYRDLIKSIKNKFPKANIYVQSVLPVTAEAEKESPHTNNKYINECNEGLKNMTAEEKVQFVNIQEVLNEGNKSLYEPDGTHFKDGFYTLWLNYLDDKVNKSK